jgi:alpha-L-fucosidase 2
LLLQYSIFAFTQNNKPGVGEIGLFKNHWTNPPSHIPNDVSIDGPLMGNGDVTMSLGYKGDCLRYCKCWYKKFSYIPGIPWFH